MTVYSLDVLLFLFGTSVVHAQFNCCFLTCIQVSQEADQVVWYSHLLKNFPVYCDPHSQRLFGMSSQKSCSISPFCNFLSSLCCVQYRKVFKMYYKMPLSTNHQKIIQKILVDSVKTLSKQNKCLSLPVIRTNYQGIKFLFFSFSMKILSSNSFSLNVIPTNLSFLRWELKIYGEGYSLFLYFSLMYSGFCFFCFFFFFFNFKREG